MKRLAIFSAAALLLAGSSFPMGAVRANAQEQSTVNADNLDQMIANAKTPSDRAAIASYYQQEAAEAQQKASMHSRTAEVYRKDQSAKPAYKIELSNDLASMWRKIARDDARLAKAYGSNGSDNGISTDEGASSH